MLGRHTLQSDMLSLYIFFLRMWLRHIVGQPGSSSIISRVKLGQTTVQLGKRAGFDDVGHRLGLTTGAVGHRSVSNTCYHWNLQTMWLYRWRTHTYCSQACYHYNLQTMPYWGYQVAKYYQPVWLYQWRTRPVCRQHRSRRCHCWVTAAPPALTMTSMWHLVSCPGCHVQL